MRKGLAMTSMTVMSWLVAGGASWALALPQPVTPAIKNITIKASGTAGTYDLTITGSNFGPTPAVACTNTATCPNVTIAGAATITVNSWASSNVKLTVAFTAISAGVYPSQSYVALENSQSVRFGVKQFSLNTTGTQPTITGVTTTPAFQNTTFMVAGSNFGSAPISMPNVSADTNQFQITIWDGSSYTPNSFTAGYDATNGVDSGVTLNYQSWSPTAINIGGFSHEYNILYENHYYWVANAGDPYVVMVINPSLPAGSNTAYYAGILGLN